MHRVVKSVILLAICLSMTGCGGCTSSEADMRRYSRVRSPDELESAVQPPPAAGAARSAATPDGAKVAQTKVPGNASAKVDAAGPGSSSSAMTEPQQAKPKEVPVLVAFAPETPPSETSPVTTVVENPKPAKLLTSREARTRTLKNLIRIGKAINDYVAKYGQFPPRAIRGDSGDFGLSWRVAILPQLGHEALYNQFRLYESWDSPHNKQLLDQIPPEFQSPERFDSSTNYLAVAAPDSVFLRAEPIGPRAISDGAANTIMVVEADDTHAVPWSRPADLVVTVSQPRTGLGTLRGDGFLCLLADGKVLRAPPTVSSTALISLFTCQGEESITAEATLTAPTLVPPTIANALAVDAAGGEASASEPGSESLTQPSAPQSLQDLETAGPPPIPKLTVPDEIALAKAREQLKDLYGDRLAAAPKPEDRSKLIQSMLSDASTMEDSPADYYELLRIVRDIAGTSGDVTSALQAIELLEKKYQIDGLSMRLKSLDELAKFAQKPEVAKALPDMAKDVLILCIDRDDYDSADRVAEQVLALARSARDGGEVQRASQTISSLAAARTAYNHVPIALKRLESDPHDGAASETIGKYLCLVKGRWNTGLPYLMKGDDLKLRVVATIDLLPDRKAKETASLADQYWDMADDFKQPQKRNLKLRAAFWYKIAAIQLSDGLQKSQAKRRIADAEVMYGAFEVERAITRMISDANLTAVIGTPKESGE
jgi:hypothetical protein